MPSGCRMDMRCKLEGASNCVCSVRPKQVLARKQLRSRSRIVTSLTLARISSDCLVVKAHRHADILLITG